MEAVEEVVVEKVYGDPDPVEPVKPEIDIDYFGSLDLRVCKIVKAAEIRKTVGDRALLRALHFIRENARVERMLTALASGNIEGFLAIIKESGNSSATLLQNYYSPKAPEEQGITLACAIASEILGEKAAWRVHGGGFAGTMQAFVPHEKMDEFRTTMEKVFGEGAVTELSVRPLGAASVYHG